MKMVLTRTARLLLSGCLMVNKKGATFFDKPTESGGILTAVVFDGKCTVAFWRVVDGSLYVLPGIKGLSVPDLLEMGYTQRESKTNG